MFEGFLNPALLAGLGLASVPILIHLLNRRRYRPTPWAAMRFVLAAYRKTRRRVQLENLLLLLLRVAGIACLALAVARPFTGSSSPLSALGETRHELILVLDASGSTGYRDGLHSSFDRILERARDLLAALDVERGDRVYLLLAGDHTRHLSRGGPDEALSVLSTVSEPTDESLNLAAALGEVLAILRETAPAVAAIPAEVRFLTDLQRTCFEEGGPHGGALRAGIHDLLDELAILEAPVLVEDLGPAPLLPQNIGLVSIAPVGPLPRAGARATIAVTVANYGPEGRSAVRLSLEADGRRLPSQRIDLPAGETTQALFDVRFPMAGHTLITASLEGDGLALDDSRSRVVPVAPPTRVLLVNGAAAPEIDRDAVGLVRAVLEPTPQAFGGGWGAGSVSAAEAPFDPREVRPEELATVDLSTVDVILLANVPRLADEWVLLLEKRVAAGAGLWISCGDRMDVSAWNRSLFRSDGTGLLPAELGPAIAVADRRANWYRVADFDEAHPALAFFADEIWRPLLTEVPVYQFLTARPLPGTRVLATLDDADHSPLLLERPYDRGRVVLWTSTLDPSWTRLSESPASLVPLTHELLHHLGRSEQAPRNVSPGGSVAIEVGAWPRSPEWVGPDASRRPLEGESLQTPAGTWRLPALAGPATARAGAYRILLEGGAREPFAVQADPQEGNLARLAPGELAQIHPALVAVDGDTKDRRGDQPGAAEGELWRYLAAAALLALVLETLWAAWLGTRRRSV